MQFIHIIHVVLCVPVLQGYNNRNAGSIHLMVGPMGVGFFSRPLYTFLQIPRHLAEELGNKCRNCLSSNLMRCPEHIGSEPLDHLCCTKNLSAAQAGAVFSPVCAIGFFMQNWSGLPAAPGKASDTSRSMAPFSRVFSRRFLPVDFRSATKSQIHSYRFAKYGRALKGLPHNCQSDEAKVKIDCGGPALAVGIR